VGIWAVLHEICSDYAQIMSVLFLGIVGPGPWSLDAIFARKQKLTSVAIVKEALLVPVPAPLPR
jgi:hypothetical protein